MTTFGPSSIKSSESTVESILLLNYTISDTFDQKNSTQISDFSTKEFPEITAITPNCFFDNSRILEFRKSISPSETSTETVTLNSINKKTESMKSESSQGTDSSSSLTSTKPFALEGLPALHPLQVRILKEVKRNLEITRDKVKKFELENRQIPVLRKRLDQLETELRFQNFTSPDESSLDFSSLLSSSVPVSHLSSSPLTPLELTPALLLAEIYRALNCDGSGLSNGKGGDNKSADFLPPLRKQLLKRVNELKRNELQGATAHQKMLDSLSRQVVCMNTKSDELSRKLMDFRASIKMVSTAREQISQKGIEYFQNQWDSVVQNKSPVSERVKKLEVECAQLQQKVEHYKNSIMFYKTENETLGTQIQPFKTASKASTSILEEVKSLRSLVKNAQEDSAASSSENGALSEQLQDMRGQLERRRAEVEGEEKFLRMEEERDSANKLAQDCQQKVCSLSSSLHQISSLMMDEKNRNDSLKKENKGMEEELQITKSELEDKAMFEVQMTEFKSEVRHKEREIAQLLESLQRLEMTKDDLRRSDRELKQFRTKSQMSETRNRELTTQISNCVDNEAALQDELHSLQNKLKKQENTILSIQTLFPVPGPATTLLDQVQGQISELGEAKELVEFLQAEKSMEEETAGSGSDESLKELETLREADSKLREEVADMKLIREAFLSQIDTLEAQLEESADRESTETLTAEKERLEQQLDVVRAQYDMKTQDLAEQITDLDSLMHANDIQNAKERDELQNKVETLEESLAQAKDELAIQSAEIADKRDQVTYLTQELEDKKAKAQGMMDKFFPGGMPTLQLIDEANHKLQDSLTSEKEQLLKQRDEHQKLEQQVSLLDTWLQQCKKEKEENEQERNQLKEANQGKLKKIIQLESVDQLNKQLIKELKEVEREVIKLRMKEETYQKIQDLSSYKQ